MSTSFAFPNKRSVRLRSKLLSSSLTSTISVNFTQRFGSTVNLMGKDCVLLDSVLEYKMIWSSKSTVTKRQFVSLSHLPLAPLCFIFLSQPACLPVKSCAHGSSKPWVSVHTNVHLSGFDAGSPILTN